jgi:hypothetical protein
VAGRREGKARGQGRRRRLAEGLPRRQEVARPGENRGGGARRVVVAAGAPASRRRPQGAFQRRLSACHGEADAKRADGTSVFAPAEARGVGARPGRARLRDCHADPPRREEFLTRRSSPGRSARHATKARFPSTPGASMRRPGRRTETPSRLRAPTATGLTRFFPSRTHPRRATL